MRKTQKQKECVCADLIRRQDAEGGDDLLRGVGVGCLSGHEVDEGLEGDGALSVGIHQGHDAGKLSFTLRRGGKDTPASGAHSYAQSQPAALPCCLPVALGSR